ncbi:MAG: MBL fold metallo-hydrolase [Dehalococcoidia bacterium]|nr:MBL fold metallo-hydrolase [Dehalococcoidia bacterium]
MDIYWLGHSCFRLKGKGSNIIIDPVSPEVGYTIGKLEADIVAVTHQHPGHNYVQGVGGPVKVVSGPGEYEIGGVFITGVPSFHDDKSGEIRGMNTIFNIEMDGITVAHLGDLGHVLTSKTAAEIGRVDVLLVPVGGVSTIDAIGAAEVVRRLSPKWVVPMHYKTPATKRDLDTVDKFLKEMGAKDLISQPRLSVTSTGSQTSLQVVLLDYPGGKGQSASAVS